MNCINNYPVVIGLYNSATKTMNLVRKYTPTMIIQTSWSQIGPLKLTELIVYTVIRYWKWLQCFFLSIIYYYDLY